jgi:hypothetical protein
MLVTFLVVLLVSISSSCGSKGNGDERETKESAATAVKEGGESQQIEEKSKQETLFKTETPAVPVKMEIKPFDKPESANYWYYFEAGLNFPQTVETVVSQTDRFAFSPQKLFDADPLTCMAVTQDYLRAGSKRFLSLYSNYNVHLNRFYVTTQITGFVIEGGYFNEAYYRKNARVKEIRIIIESADDRKYSETKIIDEKFALNDTMEPQIFVFKNRPGKLIYAVDIYVTDTYNGEEWQDVCISGLSFLSDNYIVPIKLNPESNMYVDWYCDNKLPVIGRWRVDMGAENITGIIQISYDGEGRIRRLKLYNTYGEYVRRPPEITCSYIYSTDKITVYDETNNRRICEYIFQDGKLIYERRGKFSFLSNDYGDDVEKEFTYTNGENSSDNVREFVTRDDQYGHEILRMAEAGSSHFSEHDIYDTNGVIVRSRRNTNWVLPPIQFL